MRLHGALPGFIPKYHPCRTRRFPPLLFANYTIALARKICWSSITLYFLSLISLQHLTVLGIFYLSFEAEGLPLLPFSVFFVSAWAMRISFILPPIVS